MPFNVIWCYFIELLHLVHWLYTLSGLVPTKQNWFHFATDSKNILLNTLQNVNHIWWGILIFFRTPSGIYNVNAIGNVRMKYVDNALDPLPSPWWEVWSSLVYKTNNCLLTPESSIFWFIIRLLHISNIGTVATGLKYFLIKQCEHQHIGWIGILWIQSYITHSYCIYVEILICVYQLASSFQCICHLTGFDDLICSKNWNDIHSKAILLFKQDVVFIE